MEIKTHQRYILQTRKEVEAIYSLFATTDMDRVALSNFCSVSERDYYPEDTENCFITTDELVEWIGETMDTQKKFPITLDRDEVDKILCNLVERMTVGTFDGEEFYSTAEMLGYPTAFAMMCGKLNWPVR